MLFIIIKRYTISDLYFLGHPKWNEGSHEQRIKNQALRSSALSSPAVEDFEKHEGTHILQSLDGFAIALNSDGRFLYISETVSIYLGLSQVRYLFEIQILFYLHFKGVMIIVCTMR